MSSNPNDKNQVLRMISSVLDFTQGESDKVGLNKQQSSWFGAILGGGAGAQGNTECTFEFEIFFFTFLPFHLFHNPTIQVYIPRKI